MKNECGGGGEWEQGVLLGSCDMPRVSGMVSKLRTAL